MRCPPGELAVADLAPAGRAHAPRLAHGVGREVVVQHVVLADVAAERVDQLLVLAGAERGDDQSLRLAAREERAAVHAGQNADRRRDRTDRLGVAPIDALPVIEDLAAHDLLLEMLELARDRLRDLGLVRRQLLDRLGAYRRDLLEPGLLHGLRIGLAQLGLVALLEGAIDLAVVDGSELPGLLGAALRQIDDEIDHRLELLLAEHHGRQHGLLGQLLGFQLDHHHRVARARDDEIEGALLELIERRVEDELAVLVADPRGADRAEEGNAAHRQRRRGADHRDDVRIGLAIVGQHGRHDLRLVPEALWEERADRTIDQARGQRLLLGRTALALEEAARDLARGERLLLVVHRKREEVLPGLDASVRDRRAEHDGLSQRRQNRPVRLSGDAPGLKDEGLAGPAHLLARNA